MPGKDIKIRSRNGGEFDCYLAKPAASAKVPAIVLASSVHGVDADLRGIADAFADAGYIAAAPDLFWRTVPGPLPREDKRAAERAQPRLPVIATGETDMADALLAVRQVRQHNGKAVAMGLCFGGPYSVIGVKRLGYDAGIGCHSTQMKDYLDEFDGLTKPVCLIWGDQDHAAPPDVQTAYMAKAKKVASLEVHIFPGIHHGYMMRNNAKAWDQTTYDFSMGKALDLLKSLH